MKAGADTLIDARRRELILAAPGAALALAACGRDASPPVVHDVAQLEAMPVGRIVRPRATADVADLLRHGSGPVSIGGGRFSMGGQIACPRSLHLDLRSLRGVLRLDPAARTVRALAGTTWRDLQDAIDPHGLAAAVMQSYSNFTLGGSVSVNCHGRYVGRGPLVNTVRALTLVTAAGDVVHLDRASEPALFAATLGGYGGLGVVTEVELDLAANEPIERRVERVALADYPDWFRTHVLADPAMVLHNADLAPPAFDRPLAVSWVRTARAPTVTERLVPRDGDYRRDRALIWAVSELPGSTRLRAQDQAELLAAPPPVVWRNHEASLDVASLEPASRAWSTYVLEEYFVPVAGFQPFVRALSDILQRNEVNALNVSIRHSPADATSLLRWAPREVFCFVLYSKQGKGAREEAHARRWTRALIDAALALGGRYYLPYRLHASRAQFARAYPEAARFAALKRHWDPRGRFRNALWDRYLPQ
jgi:FAD/FMN-containing dehydrogenase